LGGGLGLAICHRFDDNFTEGMILSSSQDELDELARISLPARNQAVHPPAIPVLAIGQYMSLLNQKIK
jgi:hypothetical protein